MIDFAIGISGFLVKPDGSKRVCVNLSTSNCSGTPCCSESDVYASTEPPITTLSLKPQQIGTTVVKKTSPITSGFITL